MSDPSPRADAASDRDGPPHLAGTLQLVTAQPNPFVGMSRQFFAGGDRGRQLEELRHVNRGQRRIFTVTGRRGLGKSALFRALSSRLDAGVKAARINANLTSDARDVLAGVLQGFGVAAPPGADAKLLAERVQAHVEGQAVANRQCLLLVDDAHLLELRTLDLLLRIVDSTSNDALRVVFFAEPPFVRSLEKACQRMENVRAWHEIRLLPFNEHDTRQYVAFRLKDAGVAGPMPFSAAELDLVWRQSGGLPGHVNEVAASLVDGELRVVEEGRWLPRSHRALLLWLSASLVSVWLVVASWMREPVAPAVARSAQEESQDDGARIEDTWGATASEREVDSSTVPIPAATATTETEQAQAPQDDVAPAAPAAPPVESPPVAVVEREPVAAPSPQAAATPAPAPAAAQATRRASTDGAEWFFDQPRARFTLQLFGTSNRDEWRRYVRAHPDPSIASFETVRGGKPWFVVTYGSYITRAQADAAAKRLPDALGDVKPWIRTFGAIQDSIGR